MHPDPDLLTKVKEALLRAFGDLSRATAQTRQLRKLAEQTPPGEFMATAREARARTAHAQVLACTARARDAIREAHDALRTPLQRRRNAESTEGEGTSTGGADGAVTSTGGAGGADGEAGG